MKLLYKKLSNILQMSERKKNTEALQEFVTSNSLSVAKLLPLLFLASCGFFKNSLHMENDNSPASSSSGAQLASFSMSVTESSKQLPIKSSSKSLGLVESAPVQTGFNLASQTGALAADKFVASLTGCASGLSGTITGGTFNAYINDSGCKVKLTSLTIHNKVYTSTASNAVDFTTWSTGDIATFAEAGGSTIQVEVVKQLSSSVQSSDYVSYVFSILTHNSDVTVSSSHQLLVAGQDAPNFEVLNTTVDFTGNTLTFQVKCTSGLMLSDGTQNTFCPTYNGATYASGAGVNINGASNADAASKFNYALIPYDAGLTLSSARTAVTAAALDSNTRLATVSTSTDILSFSGNNDNYGFQTIALHAPDLLTSTSPYQMILILQAKNVSDPVISKSSFQYFAITLNSTVNNTCSSSPGLCLVTMTGGHAIAQSGGVSTNILPDNGATNVSVRSEFSMFFTTPTDPSAFSGQTLVSGTLVNTGAVNVTMTCNTLDQTLSVSAGENNQTIVLTMDSPLPPLASCTLIVGTYDDAVGHTGISGHTYNFTTGCATNDALDGATDTSSCYSPTWLLPELASASIATPDLITLYTSGSYQINVNAPTTQAIVPIGGYYKKFSTSNDFTATITLTRFGGILGGGNSSDVLGDACAFEAVTSLGVGGIVALSLMNSTTYTDPSTLETSGFLSVRGLATGADPTTNAVSSDSAATDSTALDPIIMQIQKTGTTFTARYSTNGGSSYTTAQSQSIPNFGPTFYLTFGGSKYTNGSSHCAFSNLTVSDDSASSYLSAMAPLYGGQD